MANEEIIECYGNIKDCQKECVFKECCQNYVREKMEFSYIFNHKKDFDGLFESMLQTDEFAQIINKIDNFEEVITTYNAIAYLCELYFADNFLFDVHMRKFYGGARNMSTVAKQLNVSRQALSQKIHNHIILFTQALNVKYECVEDKIQERSDAWNLSLMDVIIYKCFYIDRLSIRKAYNAINSLSFSVVKLFRMKQFLTSKLRGF